MKILLLSVLPVLLLLVLFVGVVHLVVFIVRRFKGM